MQNASVSGAFLFLGAPGRLDERTHTLSEPSSRRRPGPIRRGGCWRRDSSFQHRSTIAFGGYGSRPSPGRHREWCTVGGSYVLILAASSARSFALQSALLSQRAQGKPGADRTHGPRAMGRKLGGRTTGVTGNNPAFPARWVTAYFVLSPARLGLFVTVFATRTAQSEKTPATWASGPHDFTVRLTRTRQSRIRRPPHLDPRS